MVSDWGFQGLGLRQGFFKGLRSLSIYVVLKGFRPTVEGFRGKVYRAPRRHQGFFEGSKFCKCWFCFDFSRGALPGVLRFISFKLRV